MRQQFLASRYDVAGREWYLEDEVSPGVCEVCDRPIAPHTHVYHRNTPTLFSSGDHLVHEACMELYDPYMNRSGPASLTVSRGMRPGR
jgi:hypothetical protein